MTGWQRPSVRACASNSNSRSPRCPQAIELSDVAALPPRRLLFGARVRMQARGPATTIGPLSDIDWRQPSLSLD